MAHPIVPKVESVESSDNYGRFIAEPLEKGLGVTLGNALRRILLGHLEGAAVTRAKIDGIQHEFSPIPSVKEDTTEFLLNLKALRLKPLSGRPGKLVLDVSGDGQVTAGDIKPSADFEIVNPELYLATLDSPEAKLYAELDVELGTGYREAKQSENVIGVIAVDSIFTPIRKVNFTVEPTHAGRETSQERLYLEVWTDGTVSPAEAMSRSAEILMEQLSPFINYARVSRLDEGTEPVRRPSIPEELYNMPVEQLNLSVRTLNCLRRGGINTVGELVSKEEKELMALRNFGMKSAVEIKERLASLGLSLASPKGSEDMIRSSISPDGQEEEGEELQESEEKQYGS